MSMLVVKLGGSALATSDLPVWLLALATSAVPLVIVPGGGPFADFIRQAQSEMRFDDRTAHAMAVLAMEQFGHLLLEREPRLMPVRTLDEMRVANRAGVWLPSQMALAAQDIAESWDVTSDSLAAWLAKRLGSRELLLIKQAESEATDIAGLTAAGLVDPAFGSMVADAAQVYLAGPKDSVRAAALLAAGALPGRLLGEAVRHPGEGTGSGTSCLD